RDNSVSKEREETNAWMTIKLPSRACQGQTEWLTWLDNYCLNTAFAQYTVKDFSDSVNRQISQGWPADQLPKNLLQAVVIILTRAGQQAGYEEVPLDMHTIEEVALVLMIEAGLVEMVEKETTLEYTITDSSGTQPQVLGKIVSRWLEWLVEVRPPADRQSQSMSKAAKY
ncbi:MAG: hypothetical protein AB1489_41270, partial [Acidobacteriota bacterium]